MRVLFCLERRIFMYYFDQSATTQPNEEVLETYMTVSRHFFGNPSSLHALGQKTESLLRKSRQQVAQLLHADEKEIIFTSGATESNNAAIKGIAYQYQNRGNHIITTEIEHPSVLKACAQLEKQGFRVSYLPVDNEGRIHVEQIKERICEETILVSVQHVNNEVGTVQPIEEIGKLLENYRTVFFHVDGVQGIGKVPLDFKACGVDLYSLSGHKIHCVKGIGVLYIRNGIRLFPLLEGGGQELAWRAGTENLPGIVALAKALRITLDRNEEKIAQLKEIQAYLRDALGQMAEVTIHTPLEDSAPHILNISVGHIKPEVAIQELSKEEIYISSRSACSAKKSQPSHVLLAMGCTEDEARTSLRFSTSFNNTLEEAKQMMEIVPNIIQQIQDVMR